MTKQRTRRALLMSAVSMLVCISMLIGSTYAWFTDSVTSAGNIIKSGTLDVEMYWADGTKAVPTNDSTDWKDASAGAIFDYDKWEPGYAEVYHLSIANVGSLALKYQLNILANGTVTDLADVIDVYYADPAIQITDRAQLTDANKLGTLTEVLAEIDTTASGNLLAGESHVVTLALKMKEDAGNDYQEKSIGTDFAVQLLATQLTAEEDSFDDQYDADALYAVADGVYVEDDGSYVAMSMSGLSNVAALASADSSITSVTYVTDEGEVEVPVVSSSDSLDSAIAADNEIVVLTSGSYTVDNAKNTTVAIVGNGTDTQLSVESEGEYNTDYGFDGSSVTFENLVFNVNGYLNGYARMTATYNNCVINGTYTLNGASVFNNCTFNKTGDDYCVWTWGAPTAEFNNCTFNTDGKAILMYGGANTVLTMNDCVLNDSGAISGKAAIEVGSDWSTDTKEIIMTGCTVNGFDTTEEKTTTWGGTNLGTNVWGNKNLLPEDRLTVTIDGQTVYGN